MKFNNENSQEQMAYVAPRMKVFQVQITSSLLQASQEGYVPGFNGLSVDEDETAY